MRPDFVIVLPPVFDNGFGFAEAGKPVLIEAFIADFAVETLGEPVLRRFAGGDVMPFDAMFRRPLQNGTAGQFGTVVADDARGFASLMDQLMQLAHHTLPADGGIRNQRQTFPAILIHHAQDAEPAAAAKRIAQEVQAPDLIDAIRLWQRLACAGGPLAAFTLSHHKPFLAV